MYTFTKQTDTFTFGKHKGESIESIIKRNAQYVRWCVESSIIELKNKELQNEYEAQERRLPHGCGYDEYDAEMDFCMGLGGGAQGWD